ncbi:N-acetyltransferase [Pseudomonas aeruginosa]|uniref:GNAT family N-acetyltransferase n=1 Tax=Pseudomonas aeruginosa TaxID=287 RepID=UPI000E20F739|nr:GNAT family N-acetyltransferase [Pseudomonas aeruginosa]KAA5578115.1 GNAT family N-acetyltransferase [Pseudomonas aeruginosa]MCO2790567.1 N-acetyltransferase [Pseudomonas aeruginosa]RUB23063.1 N-acetyltransferase [Pseudomonas aeruginosa]HEJ2967328.1 GNAT family N-acetyltransferase [Pseudomonas aeruginosa]
MARPSARPIAVAKRACRCACGRQGMRSMPDQVSDVRLLDDGYSREVRSLFYHAYRHEPTFAYLMDAQRAGYDQRVRACVREMVERHLGEELPAIGLFIDDRLVAAALITPPQRRLDITESWSWRLRMLFSVGLAATRRYLDYHRAVQACLPVGPHHQLPMLGVHPEYQGRQIGEQLLAAVQRWCAEDSASQGLVLDTGNARYLDFYQRHGYREIGEVTLGAVREHVLLHPGDTPAAT